MKKERISNLLNRNGMALGSGRGEKEREREQRPVNGRGGWERTEGFKIKRNKRKEI